MRARASHCRSLYLHGDLPGLSSFISAISSLSTMVAPAPSLSGETAGHWLDSYRPPTGSWDEAVDAHGAVRVLPVHPELFLTRACARVDRSALSPAARTLCARPAMPMR